GAALTGGDEGLTEADRLKQEGVDLATRTKAGLVSGVSAAAAVAVPVVGVGAKSTAALVAIGGPGSFAAQQAATRAILQHAGYDQLASQYDPLDPVGLAVSTLVPAGFGLHGLRARAKLIDVVQGMESGGKRNGPDGTILTSPKGAKGEMQVMDGTNTDPGFGVTPAKDNSPAERARVGVDYLAAMVKRYGSEDKAMAAYNAGPGAVDAAVKAHGEDWLTHLPAETQSYVTRGMQKLGGESVRAATAADPDLVPAARVAQVRDTIDGAGLHAEGDTVGATQHWQAIGEASDQMAAGERVNVTSQLDLDRIKDGGKLTDLSTRIDSEIRNAARSDRAADPAARLLLDRPLPPDLIETRGTGTRFHGTSRAIDSLSNEYAMSGDSRNIYGQGFYTTDAVDVSAGYMKKGKGKEPILYNVDHTDAKLFDMEQPVTPEHQAMLQRTMGEDMPTHNHETGAPLTTMREVYDEFRKQSRDNGLTRNDVQEVFDSIRYNLEQEGYRGFRHLGGENTGSRAHDVKIFWNPEQDVKITKAALEDFHKPTPAAADASPSQPGASTAEASALADGAQQVEISQPDLMVQAEGMDHPMPAREFMDMIRKEAARDAGDADLVQVAAACALRA
ncbi:MAG: hypothetical protein JWO33_1828, partial [Caulobacteraceae bacterium]|nr:hypothetical protein [Caulobacteraceae bacterium]